MGSRPLRYTHVFPVDGGSYNFQSFNIRDQILPTTSGWSVSVESMFIIGINDIHSLGTALGLQVSVTSDGMATGGFSWEGISTPENSTENSNQTFVIGNIPLDSTVINPPVNGDLGVGYIIYQNPNTWGTRTKWILTPSDHFTFGLFYVNTNTDQQGPESASYAAMTLAFYDERTGSDEYFEPS